MLVVLSAAMAASVAITAWTGVGLPHFQGSTGDPLSVAGPASDLMVGNEADGDDAAASDHSSAAASIAGIASSAQSTGSDSSSSMAGGRSDDPLGPPSGEDATPSVQSGSSTHDALMEADETPLAATPVNGTLFPTFSIPTHRSISSVDVLQHMLAVEMTEPFGRLEPAVISTTLDQDGYTVIMTPGAPILPGDHHVRLTLGADRSALRRIRSLFTGETDPILFDGDVSLAGVSWNLDRDRYVVGDIARMTFTIAGADGMPTCGADARVEVLDPNRETQQYTTGGSGIEANATCGANGDPGHADYALSIPLPTIGEYTVTLRATVDGLQRFVTRTLRVTRSTEGLVVTRTMADRMQPGDTRRVSIIVTPSDTFIGAVVETVPEDFTIQAVDGTAVVRRSNSHQEIIWEKLWEKGKPYTLLYDVESPEGMRNGLWLLGPIEARGTIERPAGSVEQATEQASASSASASAISSAAGSSASTLASSASSSAMSMFPASVETGNTASSAQANEESDAGGSSTTAEGTRSSQASESSSPIPDPGEGEPGPLGFIGSFFRSLSNAVASLLGEEAVDGRTSVAVSEMASSEASQQSSIDTTAQTASDGTEPAMAPPNSAIQPEQPSSIFQATESRQWQLLVSTIRQNTTQEPALSAETAASPLELTATKTHFEATESPAFRLLEIELPATADGRLPDAVALAAITDATTSDAEVEKAAIEQVILEERSVFAEKTLEDSVQANAVPGALGNEAGSARRSDILQQTVTETIARSEQLQEALTEIALEDATVRETVEGTIDATERERIIAAAVSGENLAQTVRDALGAAAATIDQAVTAAVTEAVRADRETKDLLVEQVQEVASGETPPSSDPIVRVAVKNRNGEVIALPRFHFERGSVLLVLEPERSFAPGLYTLEVTITNPLSDKEQILTQDFAWGVLAMNPDRDRYRPGERAHIAFGVLDDRGDIVCDASLTLAVQTPTGEQIRLSTDDQSIAVTGTCGVMQTGFIEPDYEAYLTLPIAGTYLLMLEATTLHSTRSITSDIVVEATPRFAVRREAATRLWPIGASPMTITVDFAEPFNGTITELLPDGFDVDGVSGDGSVKKGVALPDGSGVGSTVSWTGSWEAGDSATLTYRYDAPNISPEFYLLGGLRLEGRDGTVVEELRQGQIANDTVRTWDGGGADNNWSTCANWSSDTYPTSSDTVTFDATSAKNATIDTSINVAGVNIYSSYTGIITQSAAVTVGTSGWTQSGATFTGGSQSIDVNGSFKLAAGTFTTTTGQMNVSIDDRQGEFPLFDIRSWATFAHNNGTIVFDPNVPFATGCATGGGVHHRRPHVAQSEYRDGFRDE